MRPLPLENREKADSQQEAAGEDHQQWRPTGRRSHERGGAVFAGAGAPGGIRPIDHSQRALFNLRVAVAVMP
jgi:hypothetical protein